MELVDELVMQMQWENELLRQCTNALVRLSLEPESHGFILIEAGGNYMQFITEHLDDLIWFGLVELRK